MLIFACCFLFIDHSSNYENKVHNVFGYRYIGSWIDCHAGSYVCVVIVIFEMCLYEKHCSFLADRTNGRAYATLLRLSVRLSSVRL